MKTNVRRSSLLLTVITIVVVVALDTTGVSGSDAIKIPADFYESALTAARNQQSLMAVVLSSVVAAILLIRTSLPALGITYGLVILINLVPILDEGNLPNPLINLLVPCGIAAAFLVFFRLTRKGSLPVEASSVQASPPPAFSAAEERSIERCIVMLDRCGYEVVRENTKFALRHRSGIATTYVYSSEELKHWTESAAAKEGIEFNAEK
jgi:hypothetical protein